MERDPLIVRFATNSGDKIKMKLIKLISILITGVLVSLQAAYQQQPLSYTKTLGYLDLPTPDQFTKSFHREIRDSLLRLAIAPGSSVETIIESLEDAVLVEALHDDGIDELSPADLDRKRVYEALLDLSSGTFEECSRNLAVFLSAFAQIKADYEPGLRKFAEFIEHQGRIKYSECVPVAEEQFRSIPESTAIKQLNDVFKQTFGVANEGNAKLQLHWELRTLEPTETDINWWRMLAALKGYREKTSERERDKFVQIKNFILDRCKQFEPDLRTSLTIISLARYFGFKGFIILGALIANEYNRLCMTFEKPDTRERVELHVRRQLAKTQRSGILRDGLEKFVQQSKARISIPSLDYQDLPKLFGRLFLMSVRCGVREMRQ